MSSKRGRSPSSPVGRRTLLVAGAIALVAIGVMLGSRRGGSGHEQAATVRVGTPAPAVVLPATTGNTVDLAEFRGRRNVLLYFYEHAG